MIHKYGHSRVATFYVGLRRGTQKRSRTGRCATMPDKIPVDYADDVFLTLRAEQVGHHVGATRMQAAGWWESASEPSLVYQVVYMQSEQEPTPDVFVTNMEALAEKLAAELCQDEVLLVYEDNPHRLAYGADAVAPFKKAASRAEPLRIRRVRKRLLRRRKARRRSRHTQPTLALAA